MRASIATACRTWRSIVFANSGWVDQAGVGLELLLLCVESSTMRAADTVAIRL